MESNDLKEILDEREIVYTDVVEITKNKASIIRLPY